MQSIHDASGYKGQRSALLTEEDARAHLGGISRATMIRLRQRGDLACVRIGRRVLFRLFDLDAYVEQRVEGGGP